MSDLINNVGEIENDKEIYINTKQIMLSYLRESCFFLALALTTYAALVNTHQKVGKPPPPQPFFPLNAHIDDFYKGSLDASFDKVTKSDVSMVMYYASWDAESQAARKEFMVAAEYLHDQVYFAAISCWAPKTECKLHYPKIKYFPVLVAYPQHSDGIQYRGPIEANHIIKFLLVMLRPIQRVHRIADVQQMFVQFDAVVVGSFHFSGNLGGPGYFTFYSSAFKVLERDPMNEIGYALTTSLEDSAALNITDVPNIRLYLWNETYDYPLDKEYSEEVVASWVMSKIHQAAVWVSPSGAKSFTLSRYLVNGPALLLMTPRNPIDDINPVYNLLKEISLHYYNCNANTFTSDLVKYLEESNKQLRTQDKHRRDGCSWVDRIRRMASTVIVPSALLNRSTCDVLESFCETCDRGYPEDTCGLYTEDRRHCSSELFSDELVKYSKIEKCKKYELAFKYQKRIYPRSLDVPNEKLEAIEGLACSTHTNRSLSIIAMDSLLCHQFSEALGINILDRPNKTVLAIIDNEAESSYIFEGEFNKLSIIDFILNYVEDRGGLQRKIRSSHDKQRRTISSSKFQDVTHGCGHNDTMSCVIELNSNTFLPAVLNNTQNVVVLYHSLHCAMCKSIAHLYLLLSRYMRHFTGLSFYRIDGEANDLSWEYTMDVYPSLLIFPAFAKSESRVYSTDVPYTIRNMIHFTLANLRAEDKIPAMISLCISFEKLQDDREARKCKSRIQKESYENISKVLKQIRQTNPVKLQKKILLNKLSYFRTVHLILGSVTRLHIDCSAVNDIFHLHNKYIKFLSGLR